MNDNIGGAVAPILLEKGRVVRQIERDIYLPQPNWMAFFGGDFIDVTKLETMSRSKDEHAVFWRTVASVNKSARFDDGFIRFLRRGDDATGIVIVVRQEFMLPLLWQCFNLDLLPHLKNPLASDTYLTFFGRTVANYEALYQGRDVRIGRQFAPDFGEQDGPAQESAVDALLKKLTAIGPVADIVKSVVEKGPKALFELNPSAGQAASVVSSAVSGISGILKDLFEAVQKDLTAPGEEGAS
jgi:hypothetical protein